MKRIFLFILLAVLTVAGLAAQEGVSLEKALSPLNEPWSEVEVGWTYNPWKLFMLDFMPEPVIRLDGVDYSGWSLVTSRRRSSVMRATTITEAMVLFPRDLGYDMIPSRLGGYDADNMMLLKNAYSETRVGEALGGMMGSRSWNSAENIWRAQNTRSTYGLKSAANWSVAYLTSNIVGTCMLALGGFSAITGIPEMEATDLGMTLGVGAGAVVLGNLINLLMTMIRKAEYEEIADELRAYRPAAQDGAGSDDSEQEAEEEKSAEAEDAA